MRTRRQDNHRGRILLVSLGLASPLATANPAGGPRFERTATGTEISAVDIDVKPDDAGLPAGSGTADVGAQTFATQCAACHGNSGVEGPRGRLVGGLGSLATDTPINTVGSYWQYAPTLCVYINRALRSRPPAR